MKRRTTWFAGLALCAVLVTLGAACGGDDDDEDDDTTPIASAAAATPGPSSTAAVDTTPGADGTVIDVTLNEFSVVPNKSTAPAGSITFRATNEGPEDEHELVVIRSDLAPGDLPTADDGSVPEDEVDFVDEVEGLAVGASAEITVDLAAGKYVLICNIVQTEADGTIESHYQKGMFRGLTIE